MTDKQLAKVEFAVELFQATKFIMDMEGKEFHVASLKEETLFILFRSMDDEELQFYTWVVACPEDIEHRSIEHHYERYLQE